MLDQVTRAGAFRNILPNLRGFLSDSAALAVGLTFAADSLMFGGWVTQIPFVKTRLGLDDAELGLALFGMPVGLLMMNPFAAWFLQRFGLVRTTVGSAVLMAISFVLPLWMADRLSLFLALGCTGAAVALLNIGMNTCATNIEEVTGKKIMSSCHGMWSLGGMLGSAWAALMIRMGFFPPYFLTIQALLLVVVVVIWLAPALSHVPEVRHDEQAGSRFAFPKGDLLLMIVVGACASLCEGVAFDWSAVYLRDVLGAPDQVAALGFSFFSMLMMGMRFSGDALIPYFGERKLLYFTVLFSVFSIGIIVLSPVVGVGILGFGMLGMGVALAAPILFNAAARVPGFASGAGLASYATFSFIGFLAGPPAIGFLGEQFSLSHGFIVVAALTLTTLLAVRKVGYLR